MASENAEAVRRRLKVDCTIFSSGNLQGPIDDIVAYLHTLQTTLHRKYRNRYGWFEIEFDDDDSAIYGCRWETAKEQAARLKVEGEREREQQAERDRRRQAFLLSHPHICPCCGTRYVEAKYVSNGECPACMTIPPPGFVNDTRPDTAIRVCRSSVIH